MENRYFYSTKTFLIFKIKETITQMLYIIT